MLRWILRGVLILFAVAAAGLAAVAGLLFHQGRRALDGRAEYVALGSSFASGPGVTVRVPGSALPCGRSADNYAHQLARRRHLSLVDMTCNGATAVNILRHGQFFQPAQIKAVTADTRLVTVTIGGNDVSYLRNLIALHCMNAPGDVPAWQRMIGLCTPVPLSAVEAAFAGLAANLKEITGEIHRRAPRARLIFIPYLSVLPPAGTCAALGLTRGEADRMRLVGARLNAIPREAAKAAGADFVDATAMSAVHSACAATPWVNGFVFSLSGGKFPFHPNLAGMTAIADALDRMLRHRP